jgi:uncharacterized protein
MQASIFNLAVPLPDGGDVFLMNTFTDAQLVVSRDVAALLDGREVPDPPRQAGAGEALETLREHGFIVPDRESERQALDRFFSELRHDTGELRVTVLTTLQCNFACDYCIQGDHGDYNRHAVKMSPETAERVCAWVEARLEELGSRRLVVTFFGGEPLLNLPVLYAVAERLRASAQARGVEMLVNIITNGLLLTPEVVDRLEPCGLNGVKITLDGDRGTHDRLRPLRGGQGTFDRIVRNIRAVAGRCRISIGGNFDESSAGSYPALLDFLREQEFANRLVKVNFKPIIRTPQAPAAAAPKGIIALTAVGEGAKPLNGTCMTSAGSGGASPSPCDSCHFLDETMTFLREETKKRGFPTADGVHNGPCEIHRQHAYSIGPDGSLYACPGFTGDPSQSTGHIDGREERWRRQAAARFETLAAWKACGDCSFIPVCGGGCTVASHTELGDMNTPTCHRSSFESALVALAQEAAGAAEEGEAA